MVRFARKPSWRFPNYLGRLPDIYYNHRQQLEKTSTRVHDIPLKGQYYDLQYNKERHIVERVSDCPIEVLYPKESDLGIWGGEGIVRGYIKPRKYFQAGLPRPRYWFPHLKRAILYSEILDKHLKLICTRRTLELVDSHSGFDSYILRTPVQDLKSGLALALRRQMLLTLIHNKFKDQKHGQQMIEKYRDCLIPAEEAEWFGLSVKDAVLKQRLIDAKNHKPIPLKTTLAKELIEELQKMKESGELDVIINEKENWFEKFKSKMPFFKSN